MFRSCGAIVVATVLASGCRTASGPLAPDAVSIVEGTAAPGVHVDTTHAPFAVSLERAGWRQRGTPTRRHDFWSDVAVLDVPAAERDATSIDQRTFAAALRYLTTSDPRAAAVAFRALHVTATDPLVRTRARVGLTMALTWASDWATIAQLPRERDSVAVSQDSARSAVERWAHAFATVPPPSVTVPDEPTVVPLRRSSLGTPIARVRINGHPHDFWLDTGASMTVVSADIAAEVGLRLAATDTLSLGVVGGAVDARAVMIDSLSVGGFTARGITAALVSGTTLQMDDRMQDGKRIPVHIDGVLGADLMRYMDLVIDASAGTISIRKPRPNPRATRNLFWIGFPVLRMIARDGQPLLFGLDTGAESSYITMGMLRKLPRTRVAARVGRLGGLGGKSERTDWVVGALGVSDGDYAITLHGAPIGPDRTWTFVTFDGMIGSDIALGTRLHLDFVNGVFDIRPSGASGTPTNTDGRATPE